MVKVDAPRVLVFHKLAHAAATALQSTPLCSKAFIFGQNQRRLHTGEMSASLTHSLRSLKSTRRFAVKRLIQ
jgi:hypothetical protein